MLIETENRLDKDTPVTRQTNERQSLSEIKSLKEDINLVKDKLHDISKSLSVLQKKLEKLKDKAAKATSIT